LYDEIATVVSDMEIKTEEIMGNTDSKDNIWENKLFRKCRTKGYKYMLLYVLKMEKDFDNFLQLDCVRRFRTTLI